MVVNEEIVRLFLSKLFERISPQDIAHETVGRRLAEPINLNNVSHPSKCLTLGQTAYTLEVFQSVKLWAQSTMYTQELFVHDRCERQCTEGLHTSFIHSLRVLVLALQLESKVISQMTALVVSAQQPQCVGIPDLQGPEVQNALQMSAVSQNVFAPNA